jgi:hypothetical protein
MAVRLHLTSCSAAACAAVVVDSARAARGVRLACWNVSCYKPALLLRFALVVALGVAATVAVAAAKGQRALDQVQGLCTHVLQCSGTAAGLVASCGGALQR